jgi:hypothetical protein
MTFVKLPDITSKGKWPACHFCDYPSIKGEKSSQKSWLLDNSTHELHKFAEFRNLSKRHVLFHDFILWNLSLFKRSHALTDQIISLAVFWAHWITRKRNPRELTPILQTSCLRAFMQGKGVLHWFKYKNVQDEMRTGLNLVGPLP